jgi:hypothetical protein
MIPDLLVPDCDWIRTRLVSDWHQTGNRLVPDWYQIGTRLVTDWYLSVPAWSQTGTRLVLILVIVWYMNPTGTRLVPNGIMSIYAS